MTSHPRETFALSGLEAMEARLLEQWYDGKTPHAYMFSGPKGVGKATLAYRLARFILSGEGNAAEEGPGLFGDALPPVRRTSLAVSPDQPAVGRITAGSHPDLLVIEPEFDEKKGAYKAEIGVESARRIGGFLSKTAGEGGWKIVLIDPIDALNVNAANAILKWLEEPPAHSLFILVSHRPDALLPTICSRCQTLSFGPQEHIDFTRLMTEWKIDLSEEDRQRLYRLSGGSAGVAYQLYHSRALDIYQILLGVLADGSDAALLDVSEKLTTGKDMPAWETLERLLGALCVMLAKQASGVELAVADRRERGVLTTLSARKPLDYWLDLWENSSRLLGDAERLHLSKKHALLSVLFALCGKEHIAAAIG